MIVDGYGIDLYCDVPSCESTRYQMSPAQFGGSSAREAFADVRRSGWLYSRAKGLAVCPKCARAGHTIRELEPR